MPKDSPQRVHLRFKTIEGKFIKYGNQKKCQKNNYHQQNLVKHLRLIFFTLFFILVSELCVLVKKKIILNNSASLSC